MAKDVDMVASLLDHHDPVWYDMNECEVGDSDTTLTLDDVRGFSLPCWEAIPPRFAWAIMRAMTAADKLATSKDSRGRHFKDLMNSIAERSGTVAKRSSVLILPD